MTRVLHITAHLGGGLGKVLGGLVSQTTKSNSAFEHTIICLEKPEKTQAIDSIRRSGGEVIIQPDMQTLQNRIEKADIVQLNWFNKPVFKILTQLPPLPLRLLTWWHQSGLDGKPLPLKLIQDSDIFLFTSHCSFENPELEKYLPELEDKLGVVYASGGFDDLPEPVDKSGDEISVGYFGTIDITKQKLHTQYVKYLDAVDIPRFKVKMIGDIDPCSHETLKQQCIALGKPDMIEFTGFVPDIISELNTTNVVAYLLNPGHYGTTENALLEAMAMGIVPIVLDNPAEHCIVRDGETGMIVHSPEEFAQTIRWLSDHPHERQAIGYQAAASVRYRFSVENTEKNLNSYYKEIISNSHYHNLKLFQYLLLVENNK